MKYADTLKINQGIAAADAALAWLPQIGRAIKASVLNAFGHDDPAALRAQSRRHLLALADAYEAAQPGYADELRFAAALCEEPARAAGNSPSTRPGSPDGAYRID